MKSKLLENNVLDVIKGHFSEASYSASYSVMRSDGS